VMVLFASNITIFRDSRRFRDQVISGKDSFLTSEYVYTLTNGL
ncbi:unnamed protein product, partial [Rotaria sp. Silwood1]